MFRKLTLTLCALMMMCTSVAAETLVVATNCTYPPMEFLNDKKVPNGYSIAYATEVLKGLTVGSQIGITGVLVLQEANVGAKIREYDDIGLAFEDLAAGRVDAVICDDPVAKYYANKRTDFAGKFGIAYQHNNPEYFGFCVRKGRTEMLNRLNKAIAEIKADGTENKLKVEWMGTAD